VSRGLSAKLTARTLAVTIGLVAPALLAPTGASPQERRTVTPSLTLSERFDDNIFLTADNRQTDFVTEITPGIVLKLEQPVLSLSGGYSITGQIYAENSTLDNFGDNQSAFLDASYRPGPRWTLGLNAYYARTTESEAFLRPPAVPQGTTVTTLPTVETGQDTINQGTLNASVVYKFTPTTSGTATYSFAATESATDSETLDTSHTVGLGLSRQLTAIDQASVTAAATLFDTDETTTAYSLLFGWLRQWTPNLNTDLALGPEGTDGDWGVAGRAGFTYQVERRLTVSMLLSQRTSLVVGSTEPQSATTLSGNINYQAFQALLLSGFGYIQRTTPSNDLTSGDATKDYAAGASVSYKVTTWMTAFLRYQFTLQEGGPGNPGDIRDNQVILGVTFSHPFLF
jgi:hypothetical protein